MTVAADERRELCALFDALGPDAPTLCEGWRTRDLAAHLVLRERRPDAAPGILLPPLAGYSARVQRGIAQRPWLELVDLLRSGPPRWSPFAVPAIADRVEVPEYFVHHEDVRRARPDWAARPGDPTRDRSLWRQVGLTARLTYRRSPVALVLRRPDGAQHAVVRGPRLVTIIGEPGELLLHATGRDEVIVEFGGDEADVAAVQGLQRGF